MNAKTETTTPNGGSRHPVVIPQLGDRRYWLAEVNRLREMWGTKTFWADTERASRAISGLLYVWMKTENQTPQDEVLMGATCMEFDRRLLYALAAV